MKTRAYTLAIFIVFLVIPQTSFAEMFYRDLSMGSTGADVKALQTLLNKDESTRVSETGPGSPGQETTYFGPATKSAVVRFQDNHKEVILEPINISSGTGFVGPSTRRVLNLEIIPSIQQGPTSRAQPSQTEGPQVPQNTNIETTSAEGQCQDLSDCPFGYYCSSNGECLEFDGEPCEEGQDGDGCSGGGDGDGDGEWPPVINGPEDFPEYPGDWPDDFNSGDIEPLNVIAALLSLPFGGTLLNTDYATCSCGGVVLTIQEKRTQAPMRIVYFYALDVLKRFGVIPNEIPTPTLYMFYNIFTPGVEHLGKFIPVPGAPCLRIIPVPPYCTPTPSGGAGYLLMLGTSLFPGP